MRYLGGKFKIAKDVAKLINSHKGFYYLEPFMGSCWVTAEVKFPQRIAGDIHDEIVELYHTVQNGWLPPETLTKEEFEDIRANRTTNKYPKQLIAFVGFGCAFAGSYWRSYAGEIYASRSKKSVLKKAEHLKDVKYFCSDYKDLNPSGCVIYCDPPYSDSFSYRITGIKGNGKFNNKEFWELMEKWAENNIVYVSEYQAPDSFNCVFEKEVTMGVRTLKGNEKRTERVFCKNTNPKLRQESADIREVLGVNSDWKGLK